MLGEALGRDGSVVPPVHADVDPPGAIRCAPLAERVVNVAMQQRHVLVAKLVLGVAVLVV